MPRPACSKISIVNFRANVVHGEASAIDFQVFELFRIVEIFASEFDDLPALIPGRDDYRILIGVGMVVARFSVVGQLASDGAVELVQLDIDTDAPW